MGQFTQNGVIYEEMPNGQVKVVGYANGGAMPIGGPDPMKPLEIQSARGKAAAAPYEAPKAQADVATAEAQARIAEAQASVANAKNATELESAKANLAKTQLELQQLQGGKNSALDALQNQVDRVNLLFNRNVKGGLPNPIAGHLPLPSYDQFNSAAQGLINPFMAAFRIPGVGSQSDTELRQFMEANTPSATDSDLRVEEKLRNIQTRIDAEREARGQKSPTASNSLPPVTVPDQGQATIATGETRAQVDPVLQKVGNRVGAMIASGIPDKSIMAFLKQAGIDPANTNIQQALQFRKTDDFKRWQRANPGQAYPIGPDFYTTQVPMTPARQLFNQTAATGPGGALAAGAVSAANTLSGNRLSDITGDPAAAKVGMSLLRENHPAADLAGSVAGQATLEAGAGLIPGVGPLLLTKGGRRLADLGFGAYYGSGGTDDPLTGGLEGALVNAGGGMFGRGLQRNAGRVATGVKNANLSYLDKRGIPLTVGQIGNGSDSVAGKAIGGIEDRAAGLPVFDAIINSARRRGEQGFNRAAFQEMGGSGATGAAGVQEGKNLVNNAYSFLDPVEIPLDAQFAGSQAAVRANLPNLPKFGPEVGTGLNVIDKAAANGALTGRDWQQALRTVKSDRSSLRGKEFSQGAIDSLGDVEANLTDLAARQAPPELQGNLAAANNLNKQFNTITAALDNGPSQARGELFSPSRLNTSSLANTRKFGGRTSAVAGDRPFYDLTTAGMDVMPNQVPDSGTAGRALLYSLLFGGGLGGTAGAAFSPDDRAGGASEGSKLGAGIPLAVAALYSKPGQKILQRALLGDRGERITKLGKYLINNARLGGMFGGAASRNYIMPELSQ